MKISRSGAFSSQGSALQVHGFSARWAYASEEGSSRTRKPNCQETPEPLHEQREKREREREGRERERGRESEREQQQANHKNKNSQKRRITRTRRRSRNITHGVKMTNTCGKDTQH